MGGGRDSSQVPSSEVLSLDEEDSLSFSKDEWARSGSFNWKPEDASVDGEDRSLFGEFDALPHPISAYPSDFEANRRRRSVFEEVQRSYVELRRRSESLEAAKIIILSYTPGVWIEKVGGLKLSDYDVPETSSLLLIGPKGSGKSSLVNRISRVFEDDKFSPERAQVSYNSSIGDGTYFLQEYMIPRGSTSFCLYDTRSLSDDMPENMEMLKRWMTKGVRNGEPVARRSDGSSLKTRMKYKARRNGYSPSKVRKINFVIFVVSGLSVLKSMDSDDGDTERVYTQMIAAVFNCPFLSFRDDKPIVVVTHGDLLSPFDRTRVRVHLGELLGVSPHKQIFDIPERCNPAAELAIVDMLRYALEHSDRNLPRKGWFMGKLYTSSVPVICILFMVLLALGIALLSAHIHGARPHLAESADSRRAMQQDILIEWHAIRHLWLGSNGD